MVEETSNSKVESMFKTASWPAAKRNTQAAVRVILLLCALANKRLMALLLTVNLRTKNKSAQRGLCRKM